MGEDSTRDTELLMANKANARRERRIAGCFERLDALLERMAGNVATLGRLGRHVHELEHTMANDFAALKDELDTTKQAVLDDEAADKANADRQDAVIATLEQKIADLVAGQPTDFSAEIQELKDIRASMTSPNPPTT